MEFFELLTIIFVITISLSCAFFFRLIIWTVKKNVGGGGILVGSCKNSLVLLCVSLSISIICVAVFFTMLDWDKCIASIHTGDLFYYGVLFAIFFIPTVFFKVLAPVFLALYILYCGIFAFLFIDSYDVYNQSVTTMQHTGEIISISPKNLLPLPQKWQSAEIDTELFSETIKKCEYPMFQNAIRFISSLIILES